MSAAEAQRVVVVGGGVAGLAAAHRLLHPAPTDPPEGRPLDVRPRPKVTMVEADGRVGGKVRSAQIADLTLEAGADSFVARKPWAVDLCRELGLGRELVAPASSAAYLWTEGGLVAFLKGSAFGIPSDVGDVMRWPGLSRAGRLRAAQDLVRKPRKEPGDESLGSLLRRRLGDEATDLAVGPLLAGLFAGDVDRLSVQATFPELTAWEREQGSLIRGAQAARRSAERDEPGPMFLKLAGGIQRLTDALADAVGRERLVLDWPAERIEPDGDGWAVRGAAGASLSADALIVATPAFESSRVLAAWPEVSAELQGIPYVSTGVVFLVYPEGTRDALPEGTGFVVPAGRAPMTACTWLSNKWPREEYGSRAVVRCYVGGAGAEDVLDASDDEIVGAVSRHLAALLPLPGRPQAWGIHRWRRAMPQYEVGHQDRVRAIRAALPGGIFVAGSAYGGVGIPDSIRDAAQAAVAVEEHLARRMEQDKETVR